MLKVLSKIKRELGKITKGILHKRIVVLSDSHGEVFNFINKNKPRYFFDLTKVGGATAMGIVNPNSKTNCLKIFNKKLLITPKRTPKIILLANENCSMFYELPTGGVFILK